MGAEQENWRQVHRIIRVGQEIDVAGLTKEVPLFGQVRLMGFDMDGTLVGPGIEFPLNGLLAIREVGIEIAIVSGAGFGGVARKLKQARGADLKRVSEVFSAPAIINDGAQIFSRDSRVDELRVEDILEEVPIDNRGRNFLVDWARANMHSVRQFRFYPASKSGQNPFHYVAYVQEKNELAELQEKYYGLVVAENFEEFIDFFRKWGASKFVVVANTGEEERLARTLSESGLVRAVANEKEFVNVVSVEVDKFKGLRRITEMLWARMIESSELMYWGNDFNDLEALEGCGIGVVVNSYPEIAERLVATLARKKNFGYTLIMNPEDTELLLREVAGARI